ncbi:MAG TPA: hypothetical protein VLK25_02455 [Allosphingosinicella sp.]|nr:hypothetical protein [Allosphingosinicella sp.]
MAEAARSWPAQAGAMLLIGVAGLLVFMAGIAIVFVLPITLVFVAMGYEIGPAAGIGNWFFILWFPLAFAACFYLLVAGFEAVSTPRLGIVSRMVGVALLAFFTFPPFLFPLP